MQKCLLVEIVDDLYIDLSTQVKIKAKHLTNNNPFFMTKPIRGLAQD